jgi:hypothetical protein
LYIVHVYFGKYTAPSPGGNMCLISEEEKYEMGKEKKWENVE